LHNLHDLRDTKLQMSDTNFQQSHLGRNLRLIEVCMNKMILVSIDPKLAKVQ
jgi:hypothetical protein